MITYRVKLEADDNGTVLVTCPDFPEVITCGDDRDDALRMAVGAFQEVIASKIHNREPVPAPSKVRKGDAFVVLPMQTEMKVKLYQSMRESGVRKSELARRLKLHRQEIERLLDFGQSTNLGKLESAFAAMGKKLTIEVADADK